MSVVVVMPSRGRPARAHEAVDCARKTAALVATSIVVVVDADDPTHAEYARLRWDGPGPEVTVVTLPVDETGNLVKATNTISLRIADAEPDAIIGNLGDDHLVRTADWDRRITAVLASPGIAYGDDTIHGKHLPSAPFISASIVRALGWYALPTCHHLYIDDAWRELGKALGMLHYLPDVVIEHMHPSVGKRESDDGYRRANSRETVKHDHEAFLAWMDRDLLRDARRVRRALRKVAA